MGEFPLDNLATYTLFLYKNDVISFEPQFSFLASKFLSILRIFLFIETMMAFGDNFSHDLTLDKVGHACIYLSYFKFRENLSFNILIDYILIKRKECKLF